MTKTENFYRENAVRLLANGFSDEFADFVAGNEKVHELMMDLASVFVDEHIPIVNEEDQIDVAAELIMCITVRKV